jgi:hypothetical protein
LSDHLGNVLVTVSDRKLSVDSNNDGTVDYYTANVITANDYSAYNATLEGRTFSQPNATYRYSLNGQEKSDEIAPNTTTAQFWEYDSRIGRRWNLDPKPIDGESQYSVFSNSPIWHNDIEGDTLNDPNSIVANLTKSISDQKAYIDDAIKNSTLPQGVSETDAKAYEAQMNNTLADINTLKNSDQVYDVYTDPSGNTSEGQGATRYNPSTHHVDVAFSPDVSSRDIYLQAHEILHAAQFDRGELSLLSNGGGAGSLADITDDVAANNRQTALASGLLGFNTRTVYTPSTLRVFTFPDGQQYYNALPNGPINLTTTAGIALRQQTIMAGLNHTFVKDIYHGYEKDYKKGQDERQQISFPQKFRKI